MSKQSDTKKEGLNRARTLRFRVTAVEEAEIESRARNAGLSLSALLRTGALHHPIRSVVDLKAVADLGFVRKVLPHTA
ncbi:hypothetical protein V2J59_09180 [Pseudomonas alliivorans]|uniref:Mobilization protein n=1 Tax=Pseudomonas alliivorans TaxID=2810613 RepID=A0ABS4BZM4_9PSED|nr:hypothetical protein [Pseudomonas alliivorans]MBP0943842.1 hypothetical protein [Pseudomonas alliivorans]MEE4325868.1 hypothetical protein [Pseudomonas alliivorans]MEE4367398.1 hypothetical protein [Pseudomonas alliivorans]